MRSALLLLCCVTAAGAADQRDTVLRVGDYTAALTDHGLVVTHRGETICHGCYLTVFKPGYQGQLIGWTPAWRAGTVTADGRSLRLAAKLPQGTLTYLVELSAEGVRTTAKVGIDAGVEVGPVEYPVFQLPAKVVAGATVEVYSSAGIRVDRQPVPDPPKRGGFAQGGEELRLRAAERTLVITRLSGNAVYPFDARVEQYGRQQGLWPFSSVSAQAGQEAEAVFELRVEPARPRPAGSLTITGVPATAIATVPEPTAREKLAAGELADYFEQITGRRLARSELAGGVPAGVIAVGRLAVSGGLVAAAEVSGLQRDGYLVRVRDGRAAVCGWRDLGAVYGAYALLQGLGVRFYAPGCEVVPETDRLDLPPVELRAVPRYEFRHCTGNLKLGHTPNDDCGNPRDIGQPGGLVHAADYLVPFDQYGEQHPEYFALQADGRRLHRGPEGSRFDVHLCLANPDVRRISAERLLKLIEAQPDRTFFGVSQGDGHAWCRCPACQALDGVPGVEMTDRLLDYVNAIAREVAQQYPDKRIVTLAYTDATSPPPRRVMPEPNVMVQFCPYPRRVACQSHDLTCDRNAVGYADLQGWIAKCPNNLYIFDYPRGYQTWYEPFGSFWAMKRKLDYYTANGIKGLYHCGVPDTFRDLFVYVQSRLLWSPEADVAALMDDFMSHYYGAAAPAMREWFDLMHQEVDERPVHQMCEGPNPGLVTAELAEQALAIYARAEAAAGDRAALYRVRAEKMLVLFADVNERNPVNGKLAVDEAEFAKRLAEMLDIARQRRLGTLARREAGVVSDWLYKVARVRTQRNPWYTDALIDRLAAKPAETLAAERQLYAQTKIDGGWRLELDGFCGGKGPETYSYQCEPRRAVWIYGTNTATPAMWTKVKLEAQPAAARLVLVAQDDDKPGSVTLRVTVNGREVFQGPNGHREKGWSENTIALPAGVLQAGANEIRIETTTPSSARDAGWFMLAELKLLLE